MTFVQGVRQLGDQGHEFIQLTYVTSDAMLSIEAIDISTTPASLAESPRLQQGTTEVVDVRNHSGYLTSVQSDILLHYLTWQEAGLRFTLGGALDAATIQTMAEQLVPLANVNGGNAAPSEQTSR